MEDEKGEAIVDLQWYIPNKNGAWQTFTIPAGQEIIGMQCNTE